jgi:DNA repair protein RadC
MTDKTLTNGLKEALALVDVKVLDHIVVSGVSTYSFAENGDL